MHAFAVIHPESYSFYNGKSVNGSSPTGNCSNSRLPGELMTCLQPNSSFLFDGRVPTLTGLDGDMWASQLLIIQSINGRIDISSSFIEETALIPDSDINVTIERVEVVMLNCPESSQSISLEISVGNRENLSFITEKDLGSVTSCDSLVRVCISVNTNSLQVLRMRFLSGRQDYLLYLAEVTFYSHNSACSSSDHNSTSGSPDIILTSPTQPPDTMSSVEQIADTGTITIADKITVGVAAVFIIIIIAILIAFLILCIVCTTKHKHQLRTKEDHTTTHRQTHSHQPPQNRGHISLWCEETGQAYYSSLHDIQGEDVPADQVYNRLERDTALVRGGAKSSRGATVNRNKAEVGAYSTVSYSKQPQGSKEAAVAQVIFATDQQEEASASALYAQVDEKRKKKKEEDTQPHEPDHLYAQVDKKKSKKKKEDSPPSEFDQLYAQVDKKKSKKKKEECPPPELDQLYAQVDKKKRKKREKEEIEEVPPGDIYSVVNKPSAPPVPLKSHLLIKEHQLNH